MPDHSRDNISSTHANVVQASEGQVWDSLNPDQRAQLLGQSIAGEANNSVNNNSVYQRDSNNGEYASTPYSSLPPQLKFEVSNRLHEAGYFQDTYGGTSYEVEGDDRFECKDCDDEVFITEEDFRVHRKINHDDNGESETESQEAYFRSLEIDPDMTKDNLKWARKTIRGESSRVEYPQNKPSTASDPPLPKGKKEYDDNPNHYFYDNKLFKRGSRGGNYEQTGTALTEARALIELEEKILNKYGWESTKDVEKDLASRQVFAGEIEKKVNVSNLHPRTIKILDSVHRPFLVNTLSKLAQETDAEDRGDKAPFIEEEPVIHQDYDPEHPHEHNTFDQNFGDKVAEEDHEEDEYETFPKELFNDKHEKNAEEDINSELNPDNKCGMCGKTFDSRQELEDHAYGLGPHNRTTIGEEQEEETVSFKKHWGDTSDLTDDEKDETVEFPKHWGKKEGEEDEDNKEGGFWQDPSNYEVDVDEYLKTGEPVAKQPTDKRANEEEKEYPGSYDDMKYKKGELDRAEPTEHDPSFGFDYQKGEEEEDGIAKAVQATCPFCGFYSQDKEELHSHTQAHSIDDMFTGEEDFQFEDNQETTVTKEPELLQNVDTDVLQVESEDYDPDEKYDDKAEETRILQQYTGYKPKAGEALGDIMDGAIDVPEERETAEETIYNRKLEGYHEDKIARELFVYHDIEYADAIEKIRSIEVDYNDITAKTLFGKKFADCNEAEVSEMKILGGEAKRSEGVKND